MRVLIVHNRYQQRGGEDTVVAAEELLLRSYGHQVERLNADNEHIHGLVSQIQTAARSIYSVSGKQRMGEAIRAFRPDVVHVHNFFPSLSPTVFGACSAAGVPVVHTLHNYRIQCAASTLYRDGHICEECVTTGSFLPGVRHACYRSSPLGSAALGFGMALHARLGTWTADVSAYIALTRFAADKMGAYRIPRNKIHIKPNFVQDQGVGNGAGNYALFVGRLSAEKGLQTLMDADLRDQLCTQVLVIGDGPMRPALEQAAARSGSRLTIVGHASAEQIIQRMKDAQVLIIPSVWYEGQPMVFIEALSVGLPILASDVASFSAELVVRGAGTTYSSGNPEALAEALKLLMEGRDLPLMRQAARELYLSTHTPAANYKCMMQIYGQAGVVLDGA